MGKHGKKYLEAVEKIDRATLYSPEEAIKLAKQIAPAKFDETVELHLRLGIDPRHSDQQIRTHCHSAASAWARPSACWSSPKAKALASRKKPAPTSWPTTR